MIKSKNKIELFQLIAEQLSSKLELEENKIIKLLQHREKEGSTAFTSFTAIPHIVLEGEDKFCLLIARSKEGIHFSDENPAVKAIFVIMGSLDKRQLHLKALAAIAQILQNMEFRKDWLSAKSANQLKDLLLLSDRKR